MVVAQLAARYGKNMRGSIRDWASATHEQWLVAQGCPYGIVARTATERLRYDQHNACQKRASGVEMEACMLACGAREGLAPMYRPGRAYHDAIVGYVTGWTAAHISQMLAIHHRRWPFIRFVTSADTRTPGRADTQPDPASGNKPNVRRFSENTSDQRGGIQHHGG